MSVMEIHPELAYLFNSLLRSTKKNIKVPILRIRSPRNVPVITESVPMTCCHHGKLPTISKSFSRPVTLLKYHHNQLMPNQTKIASCVHNHWDTLFTPFLYKKTIFHWPNSRIPHCTSTISHNVPFCNRNVHICAHFCYKMVHCAIFV